MPVPDGTTIRLFIDEDPITCETTEVHEFERTLDMKRGTLERSIVYQLSEGRISAFTARDSVRVGASVPG